MTKFNKKFFVAIIAVGLLAVGVFIYLYFTGPEPEGILEKTKETQGAFQKEGVVFSDQTLHNFEVIRLNDGRYRMFFHKGPQIRSAISSDGRNFILESGVRLQGEMPAFVKLPDGSWRIYFKSGPGSTSIKSAITIDGFNFTIEPGERLGAGPSGSLDQDGPIHPSVVGLPDGSFKMFYDGVLFDKKDTDQFTWTIMSAASPNGLNWQKDFGVRIEVDEEDEEIFMAWSTHAEYDNGVYTLYFSAEAEPASKSGIYRATSTNGLDFVIEEGPVIGRDPEFGDRDEQTQFGPRGVPQDPFVLHTEQGERLFYWITEQGILSAFVEK